MIWLGVIPMAATAAERPSGRLIDVGGYRLHIDCRGRGRPLVVLDAGLAASAADWKSVQKMLAATHQTCTYDRAGYGMSDPGPAPRTSNRIASELRTLLERAGLPPPYLLVGHSFGGYNMRAFATLFPQDTAGLVLVDSPHEGQTQGVFQNQILRLFDPEGALQSLWSPELLTALSGELGALAGLLGAQGKPWYAALNEAAAFKVSSEELRAAPLPPELPVAVIMHGRRIFPEGALGDEMENEWLDLQKRLVTGQRRGYFVIAKDSGHLIPLEEPELIVQMVQRLLKEPRDNAVTPVPFQPPHRGGERFEC
jgi:pimeloyl-ACP methyl ester carboxylesterase